MEYFVFKVSAFDEWCAANQIAAASIGKYLCGDTEIRERLSTGRIGLWKVERLSRFMLTHPEIPPRQFRKTVTAFLQAEARPDATLEATPAPINHESQSVRVPGGSA